MKVTMSQIRMAALCALLVLSTGGGVRLAQASSPAAWSAHDREVASACTQASGLKQAAVTGQPMVFDDSLGMTALVVTGRYPQPHMKNQLGRVLCLFDRKTRQAHITSADQLRWAAPAQPTKK